MTFTSRSFRTRLLVGVSLATMTYVSPVHAQNFGARRIANPAAQTAAAVTSAASRNALAGAAAARTRASLETASRVRTQMDAAQNAARQAALMAQTNVPNGIGSGGLQVAAGAALDPTLWVGAQGPTQTEGTGGRISVMVKQTEEKAILTWDSFNVGRETDLTFDHRGNTSWITLNRVTDAGTDPSRILGSIKADGSVYVINPNGIIFGGTSQVNVRSILASSLDFSGETAVDRNRRFVNGILNDPTLLQDGGRFTFGENPDQAPVEDGTVSVEAGARLTTASGGRALFFGPNVSNAGAISSPDGQVVIAAGRQIQLRPNYSREATLFNPLLDPDLRGIEVRLGDASGGAATNTGALIADRGNIWLQGKTVDISGVLASSTSATANGSITLIAGDGEVGTAFPQPRNFGLLTIGRDASLQIVPDSESGKAIGFDQYRSSKIDILGFSVLLESGSSLYAPSGRVSIAAPGKTPLDDPSLPDGRVYLAEGASIDVSGLFVDVPASQNSLQGELRANELRDNPLLRGSVLRGRTVYFDARRGTELADLSGYYDLIERDVTELMTRGGSVTFAGPEVVTNAGSIINLSGGALNYGAGFVRSTLLVDEFGRVTAIEDAKKGVNYVGFFGDFVVDYDRWGVTETFNNAFVATRRRLEPSYTEGRSAGSLAIVEGSVNTGVVGSRILNGLVVGDVTVGRYQRGASTNPSSGNVVAVARERPAGAQLILGFSAGADQSKGTDYVIGGGSPLPEGFDFATPVPGSDQTVTFLSQELFQPGAFANVTLFSGEVGSGTLTILRDARLDLGDFGSFAFTGNRAIVDGRITAAGGRVSLTGLPMLEGDGQSQISISGEIDVAGRWVNDLASQGAGSAALPIDGGSIRMVAAKGVELRENSLLDVSGGGQLTSTGLINPGDGGSITLVSNWLGEQALPGTPSAADRLVLDGTLRGGALGVGGTLAISAGQGVVIGDQSVVQDGLLAAGTETTVALELSAPLTFEAGSTIPFASSLDIDLARPGVAALGDYQFLSGALLITSADFVVPGSGNVFTSDGGFYAAGDIVPANSEIALWDGAIPRGYVVPADAFPTGIPIVPTSVTVPAGVIDERVTLGAGTIIPRGVALALDAQVNAPLHLDPLFFRSGGFADYSIAGATGTTLLEGTVLQPDTLAQVLTVAPQSVPTGARLADIVDTRLLPDELARPTRLTLSTIWIDAISGEQGRQGIGGTTGTGVVDIRLGSQILSRAGSTVRLAGSAGVNIDGLVATPGGTIEITSGSAGGLDSFCNCLTPVVPGIVQLGAEARLLATGHVRTTYDDGIIRRAVESGGDVRFNLPIEGLGSNTAVQLITHSDSLIDVSGVRGVADFRSGEDLSLGRDRYVPVTVESDGGSIDIRSSDGVFAGRMNLAAGGPTGSGGSLSIQQIGEPYGFNSGRPGIPVMTVTQSLTDAIREQAATFDPTRTGMTIVADLLNASGADMVAIGVDIGQLDAPTGLIAFDGDVSLKVPRGFTLRSSAFSNVLGAPGDVSIEAAYIALKSTSSANAQAAPLTKGSDLAGSLTLDARLIDIFSVVDLGCGDAFCASQGVGQGFSQTVFRAEDDIRLNSSNSSTQGIRAGGALRFEAAQVYLAGIQPRTDGDGFVIDSDMSVTFAGNGRSTPQPLGAGGKLTVRAPKILQGGVLRAPFGQIDLIAGESVTLAPDSLTSVSLGGLVVPYGEVNDFVGEDDFARFINPENWLIKAVNLTAPDVSVESGARLDVSGGGDLAGFDFIEGNGGSENLLRAGGYFAIVPSFEGTFAPSLEEVDLSQNSFFDDRIGVGDTLYLAGAPGLPAGAYTLLPAGFATLPGGFLVRPQGPSDFVSPVTGYELPDGSSIVAGRRTVGFTGKLEPGFGAYAVLPNEVWRQYSQIDTASYNAFVSDRATRAGIAAPTALDAGSVVLGAGINLVLDGSGNFAAAAGGLAGGLDLSADRIAVVAGAGAIPEGYLAVEARQLSGFGAGSVLIGGVRSASTTGTNVTVNATNVLVSNDASAPLTGAEYLFAATEEVRFASGAAIAVSGTDFARTDTLLLAGDGAFVRASSAGRTPIIRTGASGATGVLNFEASAELSATGSLSLDASQQLLLSPGARLDADRLDLSSIVVSIGEVPEDVSGTILTGQVLANLSSVADLSIRAQQSIDLYGAFSLGGLQGSDFSLGALTLDAPALQGFGHSGTLTAISAGTITLANRGGEATAISGSAGLLRLDANELLLGDGAVLVSGFERVALTTGSLVGSGRGSLALEANADITADLVTAAAGSNNALTATGRLSIVSENGDVVDAEAFGGRLALAGASLNFDTVARLPAGIFELSATQGDLTLGSKAQIDVSGRSVPLRDVLRSLDGGMVRMAAVGDVVTAAAAQIEVGADPAGGNAGSVEIVAGGTADIQNSFSGASSKGEGGGLTLQATRLADFAGLNASLEQASMSSVRSIRVAEGNLSLAAGATINAREVLLRSEAGAVTIAGSINAAGSLVDPSGGDIRLIGGNGVVLASGASLDVSARPLADGSQSAASGTVEIVALGGEASIMGGSRISLTGGRGGGGTITIGAERYGDDVAIAAIAGDLVGARDVAVVGYTDYAVGEIDAALAGAMLDDATVWGGGAGAIAARLGIEAEQIHAGIRVTGEGDITLTDALDLSLTRPGGTVGYLDIDAGGNLNIGATLSDGFAGVGRDAGLLAGDSWSYRLSATGDVSIGAGAMVRTGTGTIRIDAGRDLSLIDNLSAVYTAGALTPTESGFSPSLAIAGDFPVRGGDIHLSAGRDILAPTTKQSSSAWLFRDGDTNWTGDTATSTVASQTSWGVVFANFEQGVGALGGGDVDVRAGRDIVQLAVALPTTGHQTTAIDDIARPEELIVRGGGDLSVAAGGDVKGGVFMLGSGRASVSAGNSVTVGTELTNQRDSLDGMSGGFSTKPLAALFGLMDADLVVTARSGTEVEAVFDPMLQGQICQNAACAPDQPGFLDGRGSAFYSMTERTALTMGSTSGDVVYNANPWASVDLTFGSDRPVVMIGDTLASLNFEFLRMPGTLSMTAVGGDVFLNTRQTQSGAPRLTLAPTDNGNLEIVAANAIRSQSAVGEITSIQMLDVALPYRRGALHPFALVRDGRPDLRIDQPGASTNYDRGFVPTHIDDVVPARIYALGGSLNQFFDVTLPKPLSIYAAGDLLGTFNIQNNRRDDVSRFEAGKDITTLTVFAGGIGDVVVAAGDDIDRIGGVTSYGNWRNRAIPSFLNSALPSDQGANIWMTAGMALPIERGGFAKSYFDPANPDGRVRSYAGELRSYLASLGVEAGDNELLSAFVALPSATREFFISKIFFEELKQTGIDVTDPENPRYQNYQRGYAAVKALFPGDPAKLTGDSRANMRLNAAQIETQAGGEITTIAPYGFIEVGSTSGQVRAGDGGLVTRKGGAIRMMADGDIALDVSRVFTLQGGDITMWTSNGDITAGAGAKTSVFRPPLTYTIDNDGEASVNVFGLQTGAGIGVLDAGGTGTREPSRLDLIAPRGEVNAGDAGIRVVGNLNIAALRVVNAANIDVTGDAVGIPEVPIVNTTALNAASAATSSVINEAAQLAERSRPQVRAELPTILNVRFLGFGE